MKTSNVKKIIANETPHSFGIRMAKACKEIGSSHVFFIIQQAYPELGKWLSWEDCENLLNNIIKTENK